MNALQNLVFLEALELINCSNLISLQFLHECSSLKRVVLVFHEPLLLQLPSHLEELEIRMPRTLLSILNDALNQLNRLNRISIQLLKYHRHFQADPSFDNTTIIQFLNSLPLRHLEITMDWQDEHLILSQEIASLPHLNSLKFNRYCKYDLIQIAKSKSIKQLFLTQSIIDENEIEALNSMKSLELIHCRFAVRDEVFRKKLKERMNDQQCQWIREIFLRSNDNSSRTFEEAYTNLLSSRVHSASVIVEATL